MIHICANPSIRIISKVFLFFKMISISLRQLSNLDPSLLGSTPIFILIITFQNTDNLDQAANF